MSKNVSCQTFLPLISNDDVQKIDDAALEILEKVGVCVLEEEAYNIMLDGGCERGKDSIIKIPRSLVKECLRRSPSKVHLYGRGEKRDVVLGDGDFHITSSGGVPNILDLKTDTTRKATKKDVADLARLLDALDNFQMCEIPVLTASDVPNKSMDLHGVEAQLSNNSKHGVCEFAGSNEDCINAVIDIATIIAGDEKELRKRPLISCITQTVSPLQHQKFQTKVLLRFAEKGLPLNLRPHPMGGFTSPITLAGELLISVSEVLSQIVLAQLINPGSPVIFGTSASVTDMRWGINVSGAVEIGLLGSGYAQMARYYGIPSSMASAIDSKIPDAQAVIERIMTTLPPILTGIDDVLIGAIEGKLSFSFEQLVIDDEIISCMRRLKEGIDVSSETLAVDIIKKIGPSGNYLSEKHTRDCYTKEHLIPWLFNRETRDEWEKNGSKDLRKKAYEKAQQILTKHQPEQIDKGVQREISSIIKKIEKGEYH